MKQIRHVSVGFVEDKVTLVQAFLPVRLVTLLSIVP